ncbi:hypothetical protein DFP72DRAFT_1046440 [Ephemerocybe angulata]|uniref:Uncharacterized protein n=1 Tax=Ephemerocybe angulata TaxID=980116 RepID=A0A8H6M2Z6_9AGAR|nr:hypothetical protein DFP72DRAFT_1046436 [Tulosesus angulatus]KAF6753641.1 hypothetical protein DFP72DRAFT_1046440 [Tulosesus angulatus]
MSQGSVFVDPSFYRARRGQTTACPPVPTPSHASKFLAPLVLSHFDAPFTHTTSANAAQFTKRPGSARSAHLRDARPSRAAGPEKDAPAALCTPTLPSPDTSRLEVSACDTTTQKARSLKPGRTSSRCTASPSIPASGASSRIRTRACLASRTRAPHVCALGETVGSIRATLAASTSARKMRILSEREQDCSAPFRPSAIDTCALASKTGSSSTEHPQLPSPYMPTHVPRDDGVTNALKLRRPADENACKRHAGALGRPCVAVVDASDSHTRPHDALTLAFKLRKLGKQEQLCPTYTLVRRLFGCGDTTHSPREHDDSQRTSIARVTDVGN